MPRKPSMKELTKTRLVSGYGGWIYCEHCRENIGYLCYVTYDGFNFEYQCKCGEHGSMHITFDNNEKACVSKDKLVGLKNRLCCPNDQSPLLTILEKKLVSYQYEIECVSCKITFREEKIV